MIFDVIRVGLGDLTARPAVVLASVATAEAAYDVLYDDLMEDCPENCGADDVLEWLEEMEGLYGRVNFDRPVKYVVGLRGDLGPLTLTGPQFIRRFIDEIDGNNL